MFLFEQLLSPKVRLQMVVSGVTPENAHLIKNSIQTWGLPGRIRMQGAGHMDVEIEGRQVSITHKLEELAHNPLMSHSSIQTRWLPYTGVYHFMSVTF